jgi:hypothetical protein
MERETLLKSISALLDETIEQYDSLQKAEGNPLQPNANGDMAQIAGQGSSDAMDPLKKEDEEDEIEEKKDDKKEDDKDEDKDKEDKDKKENPFIESKKEEMVEKADEDEKKDEKKDEEKKDDKKDDDKEDADEKELEKFMGLMTKAMLRMGLIKSVEDLEIKEEVIQKSEEPKVEPEKKDDELMKSLTSKIEGLEAKLAKTEAEISKISQKPAHKKQSLDGLSVIQKSGDEVPAQNQMSKTAALEKLLNIQESGKNPMVTPILVTKFEQSGDFELLKGII